MPIYHKAEAAHIIAVPAQTFRNWSVGYAYKRLDGSQVVSAPIVTTLEPGRPHGVSVPFVGLAEAYIVERGARVADIVNRLKAREPAKDVAGDYDLTLREVEEIRRAA
jgi:hypothetical protein